MLFSFFEVISQQVFSGTDLCFKLNLEQYNYFNKISNKSPLYIHFLSI